MDRAITGTNNSNLSGPGSNVNKGVLNISKAPMLVLSHQTQLRALSMALVKWSLTPLK